MSVELRKIDINKYISNGARYVSPRYLIRMLEIELGKQYSLIKEEVNNANITINEEEIIKYLDELKASKVKNTDKKLSASEEFVNNLIKKEYTYNPYTLEYFKKYTQILKHRIAIMFEIIDLLNSNYVGILNQVDRIKLIEYINSLDIDIIDPNISVNELTRIIVPLIYNIEKLFVLVNAANNKYTYGNFKVDKDVIAGKGWNEEDIYPTDAIQVKELNNYEYGLIELSESQSEGLINNHIKRLSYATNLVKDLK